MQDLEPPEVPLELMSQTPIEIPKKDVQKVGFFKRLFSKKNQPEKDSKSQVPNFPELNLPNVDFPSMELPSMDSVTADIASVNSDLNSPNQNNLPIFPSVSNQLEEFNTNLDISSKKSKADKTKGKSKGKAKKGQKRAIDNINESSQFDWNRDINDQEILIHDSNRFNQDVNILITKADNHVEETTPNTANDIFMSQHQNIQPALEPLNIQGINTSVMALPSEISNEMPKMDSNQQKIFAKLSNNHKKLQSTLNRYLKDPKMFKNKGKIMELFKQYDESVEKNIEDKEIELNKTKQNLQKFEHHLKQQEKEIKGMHVYMKGLDNKLKEREDKINTIISTDVEKELSRRLKSEKVLLKAGLSETTKLNTDLKKKVKIIEDDRVRFEREHQRMSELEKKKLTDLQIIYEKKLRELELEKKTFSEEKKAFEEKRKNSISLIMRADTVAKELDDIKKLQMQVDTTKKTFEKELSEDRELKQTITAGEQALVQEKANLDNMIFSKYIENKLKSIKPEYLETKQDWKAELQSHPLYSKITLCKQLLSQMNINDAKSLYNTIRKEYEQVQISKKEKEALYNAIRELYNEIQLKIVEAQLHSK